MSDYKILYSYVKFRVSKSTYDSVCILIQYISGWLREWARVLSEYKFIH